MEKLKNWDKIEILEQNWKTGHLDKINKIEKLGQNQLWKRKDKIGQKMTNLNTLL